MRDKEGHSCGCKIHIAFIASYLPLHVSHTAETQKAHLDLSGGISSAIRSLSHFFCHLRHHLPRLDAYMLDLCAEAPTCVISSLSFFASAYFWQCASHQRKLKSRVDRRFQPSRSAKLSLSTSPRSFGHHVMDSSLSAPGSLDWVPAEIH